MIAEFGVVTELFEVTGSAVPEPMLAELAMLPDAPGASLTTSVNAPDAPAASDPIVQVIVPALPAAGVLQAHPFGGVMRWKVVPDGDVGTVSVMVTPPVVSLGPRFVAVIV